MVREFKLKLLSEISNQDFLEDVQNIRGLISCKLEEDILCYIIDEYSSDYDILVELMNMLNDKYSIDSEPIYDEDEKIESSNEIIENVIDESLEVNQVSEEDTDKKEKNDFTESKLFKFIEYGLSVILLIIGCVLESKNLKAYTYVYVIGYAIASYEVIYECIEKFFKKEFFSEELLMTIASLASVFIGEFFEAILIMLLFNLSEMFEEYAEDNSKKVIKSLKELLPSDVVILDNGEEKVVKIENVKVNDIVICKTGEKIPLDGIIIEGSGSVDTKSLTGESIPKAVGVNDNVYSGFIAIDNGFKIQVTNDYLHSEISKIVSIVEESEEKKSKSEKFISKFARYYTPIVIVLAILLAFIPPFFTGNYGNGLRDWGYRAIMLLCISCPCSLVVSIPLSYFIGVGHGAKNGILIKGSEYLEKLSHVDTFVFDKTGTLTQGEFKITKIVSTKNYQGKLLDIVNEVEAYSNHPLAISIRNRCGAFKGGKIEDYVEIPGKGVILNKGGNKYICGTYNLLVENGVEVTENNDLGAKLYVAVNNDFAGVIVFNDIVKDNSYGAINELYEYGILDTIMLTGDSKEYASSMRKELNMKKSYSELLPNKKVEKLEEIINKSNGYVAFVGDGINDAPVIKRSDVGFSMGRMGSDIAVDASDIVITDDNIAKVPYTLRLAKRTNLIAKENIIASIAVKFIVLILSVIGLKLLWLAIVADVGMLFLTVLNSLRNNLKLN